MTHKDATAYSWPRGTVKTSDVSAFDAWTFSVDMDLLGVFDKKDDDIMTQFIRHDAVTCTLCLGCF